MNTVGISQTDIFIAANQPTDLESLSNTALSRGIDRYMRQDFKGAIKEFQRSIGLAQESPYAVDAAQYMADAYLALDDAEGAIKSYGTALRLNPYRDDIHVKLGNLYLKNQRYDEAIRSYQGAVQLYPNADNIYALGQGYLYGGRYADAEAQFGKVLRLEPGKPNGNYGLGLIYSRQGRYEDAVAQFKEAVRLDPDFSAAHAEIGYAYADLGLFDEARQVLRQLELQESDSADTLSRYIYRQDPPKIAFALANSSFNYHLPMKSPLALLDAYLANADASKTFTMKFQFDKEMDRASVENVLNWKIGRASGSGPGQAYNFGLPVGQSDAAVPPLPRHVYYDADALSATVYFDIRQNTAADATIDASHIQFTFGGTDIFGLKMDGKFDQFTGFSRVF